MSQAMWDLPQGWVWSSVGDVISSGPTNGYSGPVGENGTPTLKLSATTSGEMVVNNHTTKRLAETVPRGDRAFLRPGDLLVQRANSLQYLGAAAIYNGPPDTYVYPDLMMRLRVSDDGLRAYLWRWFNSPACREHFQSQATGTAGNMPKINGAMLREAPVPVPPHREVTDIVARLEALQAHSRAAREALADVPALLDLFRQSVLAAAFRGDLTAEWRAKNPDVEPASKLLERIRSERRRRWEEANPRKKYVEPEPVDDTDLPELPEGWCWAHVEVLCEQIVDCLHRTPTYVKESGYPAIRTADVEPGLMILDHALLVSAETYREQIQRLKPQASDIFYSREGARFGVAACVPEGVEVCMSQRMMHFRVERGMEPEYFMWALNSPIGFGQAKADVAGSASPHVNIGSIRRFVLPVAGHAEQRRIASQVGQAFAANQLLQSAIREADIDLDTLDQSILARAFRGDLVDQDPNDEPADVLLARIREGAATEGAKPARGRKKRSG